MEFDVKPVIEAIENRFSTITYKGKTTISFDGYEVKDSGVMDFLGIEFLEANNFTREVNVHFPKDKDKQTLSKKVYNVMRRKHAKDSASTLKQANLPLSRPNFEHYIPAIDVETNNKLLINSETNEVSKVIYDVWFSALDQDQKNSVPNVTRYSIFKYDPYDISTMTMIPYENFNILKINLYVPPPWRLNDAPESQSCPPEIWKFLCHLFPKADSRNFVLDWLYWALVKRQETYLVLNGAKGIGKGIFQKLARMTVGRDNYSEAPEGLLDSQFNSVLDKKRIIVFDELRVDKERHTRLKRYINKFQNIEKKGMDADRSIETFNSFIIANNDEKDMYIEYDDRRFSIPDMTTKNLYETMSQEDVATLDRLIEEEDSDLAYEFGYFLYLRGPKYNNEFSIFKGQKYYRLAHSSLAMWKKVILDKILIDKEDSIDIDRLRKMDKAANPKSQFPKDVQRIRDFLTNYKHNGTESLGELVQVDGDWMIEVNPEIISEQDDDLL